MAAELAHAKRVADYDLQRTVEQAERVKLGSVQPRFRRLGTIYREHKLLSEKPMSYWPPLEKRLEEQDLNDRSLNV
jgi:hypothetical protein